jgi:predicted DNA-binding transcriptional regulator AlpA
MSEEMNAGAGAGTGVIAVPAATAPAAGGGFGVGVVIEPFIDKREVARRLQKKVRTIDNWMSAGILPYYKIKRSVQFRWSEIESALRKHCRVGR